MPALNVVSMERSLPKPRAFLNDDYQRRLHAVLTALEQSGPQGPERVLVLVTGGDNPRDTECYLRALPDSVDRDDLLEVAFERSRPDVLEVVFELFGESGSRWMDLAERLLERNDDGLIEKWMPELAKRARDPSVLLEGLIERGHPVGLKAALRGCPASRRGRLGELAQLAKQAESRELRLAIVAFWREGR